MSDFHIQKTVNRQDEQFKFIKENGLITFCPDCDEYFDKDGKKILPNEAEIHQYQSGEYPEQKICFACLRGYISEIE